RCVSRGPRGPRALSRYVPARRYRAVQERRVRRSRRGRVMALIKDGKIVADTFVDASSGIPPTGAVIVTLEQWQAEREALLARGTPLGLRLHSDQSPELIASDVGH